MLVVRLLLLLGSLSFGPSAFLPLLLSQIAVGYGARTGR